MHFRIENKVAPKKKKTFMVFEFYIKFEIVQPATEIGGQSGGTAKLEDVIKTNNFSFKLISLCDDSNDYSHIFLIT